MADLQQKIDTFIQEHNLLPQNSSVVLGLSGGPDSVFLLHILNEYKQKGIISHLIAAHLDHQWRPDSNNDAQFCEQIAKKLNIEFVSKKSTEIPPEIKNNGSKEEIGRNMRRYFFEQVCKQYNADVIALAHHLQDQEETFFIRLVRGTTLTGLVAMKPRDGIYIRPLLEINKIDIVRYLEENKIPYLIDPTNIEETYLRNRIRKSVIPAMEQCDQRFHANFLRTNNHLQMAEQFITTIIEQIFKTIATKKGARYLINLEEFRSLDIFIQNRILVHWLIQEDVPFVLTEAYLDEIIRFLNQPGNKEHKLHQAWSLIKQDNMIYIKK